MEIGAVADVLEDMLALAERRLADPRRAFAAHVADGHGVALGHEGGHAVAADARHRHRAFGHDGRAIVRAARAKARRAQGDRGGLVRTCRQCQRLVRPFAQHRLAGQRIVARGNRLHRPVGAEFAYRTDQRRAGLVALADQTRAAGCGQIVKLTGELIFDDTALLFDEQQLLAFGGECPDALRLQRPDHRHFEQADAQLLGHGPVHAQPRESLEHIGHGLAAGDNAEPLGAGRPEHGAVDGIGPGEGLGRAVAHIEQPGFLRQRRSFAPDRQAALGQLEICRHHRRDPSVADLDRGRAIDDIGDALHPHPQAGIARQGKADQAEVDIVLDIGRIEHRNAAVDQGMIALMGNRRRTRGVVVAAQRNDPAQRAGAGKVGMFERIGRAIDPRPLAIPHAEHALMLRRANQAKLLRAPDGSRGEVFVDPGREMDAIGIEVLLRGPQRAVVDAERRAAIAGDEPCGIMPGQRIAAGLLDRQANQRLRAGDIDPAQGRGVFVVEGNRVHGLPAGSGGMTLPGFIRLLAASASSIARIAPISAADREGDR